jgi:GH25 family lysozyme M1 (1,4-beta-N-acetylmuramidase)
MTYPNRTPAKGQSTRLYRVTRSRLLRAATALAIAPLFGVASNTAAQNRAIGVDVSDWQNENAGKLPIDWSLAQKRKTAGGGGIDFAFIRATRGGTSGTFNKFTRTGTLSQRYDDFAFDYNINNATSAGVLSGPYHFLRADITTYQNGAQTVTHTARDEADHFLQVAGAYMRPGFLLPVCDLEAGNTQRTTASLSAFANEFAQRIYDVKGIRPMVYINSSYANDEVDATVAASMPNLWIARWPNQADPNSIDIQNGNPTGVASYPNVYGKWNPSYPNTPTPQPWKFWQYASTGKNIPGIAGDASGNVDVDVANGDIEFVKDFLVPALWTKNVGGSWTTISNWNTDADPSGKGGPARLPNAGDNIVLDRPNVNVAITLSSGAQKARKLFLHEQLNITGGSLNVARLADIQSTVNLTGGTLSGASFSLASGGIVNVKGGTFSPDALSVVGGMVNVASGANKTLRTRSVNVTSGKIDLVDNKMIVDYTGASSVGSWTGSKYNGVTGLIAAGRNGNAWNGVGIITTVASAKTGLTTLAVGEASQVLNISGTQTASWRGQVVDATSVLVLHTYGGDATLDGRINADDFAQIDFNFNLGGQRGYTRGDFNFDGSISADDYAVIDVNAGAQGGALSPVSVAGTAGLTAVPEPASVGALFAFALAAGTRRRRCND